MKPSLIKLQKFFKLEAERGYDNHAVLGGLERIIDRWETEARLEKVPEELIQAIVERLRDYSRLESASRAEVLEGIWRRIQREVPAAPGQEKRLPENRKVSPPQPASPPDPSPAQPAVELLPPQTTPEPAEVGEAAQGTNSAVLPAGQPAEAATERDDDGGEDFLDSEEFEQPPPRPQRMPNEKAPKVEPAALSSAITVLPGVGPRHAQTLARLGLNTLRDMLYYFPRRYDDYTKLKPINRLWYGEEVTVIGTVQSVSQRPMHSGRMQMLEAVVSDGSAALRVTWFNQPWLAKRLRNGMHIVISGKVDQYLGRLVMKSPEWEPLEQQQLSTNRIVPVYPLTANITQRWLRRLMNQVVSYWAPRLPDPLPDELQHAAGLVDLGTALYQAHFPDSWDDLKAARHRLAFDEIFLLQLGVLRQKRSWQERSAHVFDTSQGWLQAQVQHLPFTLTAAQQRALSDTRTDLASGRPMNRLLQGDVGSGKTAIAALTIGMVAAHGAQSALMAPTSILAEQHYQNMLRMLAEGEGALLKPSEIRLMVGSTPEAEKREIRQELQNGSLKLVVGTHALIEDPVTFANLQLAVVDEQHRFGVDQRAALRSKGENPHLLVMTATPIPRSLALTVYGDLELTVIDEMPPGRQPVATYVLPPRERERAYSLVRSQVEAGRQAFMIYPLVEESEKSEAKAAVDEHARLQAEVFPRLRLGLLHGRMKPDDKDAVMAAFRDGQYQILVSTTVIEVGVDVPNASVMIVEGADRFGLAQLHQLRGRVGRGAEKSYCLLIPETPDAVENERLQVMAETNDGFVLAERDLEQRGPGQFLGTRQSGFSELQLASLTDIHLIEKARRFAHQLFEQDPDLVEPGHQYLAISLARFWGDGKGDIS